MLIVSVAITSVASNAMHKRYVASGIGLVDNFARQNLLTVIYNNLEQASSTSNNILGLPLIREVAIYDANKTELFNSGDHTDTLNRRHWLTPPKTAVLAHESDKNWHFISPIYSLPANDDELVYQSNNNQELIGYAYLAMDKGEYHSIRTMLFAVTCGTASALAFILLVVLRKRLKILSKPILDIAGIMNKAQDSELSGLRAPINGSSEAVDIAIAFNRLMDALADRQEMLNTQKRALSDKVYEQLQTELHLREHRHYLNSIIDSVFDAIVITNEVGNIIQVNESTGSTLGYRKDDIENVHISNILPNISNAADMQRYAQSSLVEIPGKHRNGATVFLSLHIVEVNQYDNTVFVCTMRDITLQREYENQLNRTATQIARYADELKSKNKELDSFAYIASHDLKAPLRAISNLSSWVEEDLDVSDNPEAKEHLSLLRKRVVRMEEMINGILQYSRAGRANTEIATVNVNELLHEITGMLSPPPGLTIDIENDMPTFDCPKVLLTQVFSNLISNAIKYHDRENGKIEISVKDKADEYEFCVADDGPGIDPRYHETIFDIFQTLQARDEIESTGIGLAVVNKIIREQRGVIRIDSDIGSGARFFFTWPKSYP
ncbi:MAG: PAS domain S-box protein [Proteobacteria bacterium]|nr:PAS domain S-box protein [Pseudomonadota bacterium]